MGRLANQVELDNSRSDGKYGTNIGADSAYEEDESTRRLRLEELKARIAEVKARVEEAKARHHVS